MSGEAGAFSLGQIVVDAAAVDVDHEHGVAILRGEGLGLINEQAAVGVAAADGELVSAATFGFVPGWADPVEMVGRGREQAIGVNAPGAGGAPLDVAAENH